MSSLQLEELAQGRSLMVQRAGGRWRKERMGETVWWVREDEREERREDRRINVTDQQHRRR